MEPGGSSVRVFDGTTDFRVWRARVENELMRYHLLGYVVVRGYDGSQDFTYNGEQVPPRCAVIQVDDDQQGSVVKEEAVCGRGAANGAEQRRLSRWDVLGESAEAKSILQRYLHPDVECAILNKNIYDSWKMLCALYGNCSNPGAHDVYEMHRVLHHIRLGDKKGEPVREFITRWEMLIEQYALATGIELTDGFRSVSLVQTLPSSWTPMVASWRGIRPFVPYAELVEKVIITRDRMQAEAASASTSANSSVEKQIGQAAQKSTDKSLATPAIQPRIQPLAQPKEATVTKPVDKPVEKPVNKPADKPNDKLVEKPAEQRAAEPPNATETTTKPSKAVPPPIDVLAANTVDLTSGEVSTGSSSGVNKASVSTHSYDATKKPPIERSDKSATPRASKSSKTENSNSNSSYEKRDRYNMHDSERGYDKYASHSRYDKSPRKSRSRYEKKFSGYDDNKNGPVSCFYCLKVGHHMKRCWYLKADIENGTTHDLKRKYSCAITIDRNEYMVHCLEAYIDEVNRERAAYGASSIPRSHSEYKVAESVGHLYNSKQKKFVPPPPPGQPPAYAFRDASAGAAPDYRKRSHSVFQLAESRFASRDRRLNRSRTVFRSADVAEDFSPRKRTRSPTFEPFY
ncbi:unnamed protein product [Phytophthora lilii]|uniref:Unnamed protein product n=1 Tax=Phytophthora lilii TaxID=2077276 RepID=A0A9W6TGS6_9STRA|nr:unnamed protein product [Phytophthora lilii]